MYCLARDCARDEVVRKFVEPALELVMLSKALSVKFGREEVMLDKALRGEFDREEALLYFGEMFATALAGDGHVGPGEVVLTVGGELGGGAALLRLATLYLLNQLLSDELKFGVRTYIKRDTYYITATGGNAARFKRLLAVSAPSAGGEYLSPKFNEFVKEAQVEVRLGNVWLTQSGLAAADLTISEGGTAVKYNIYLREKEIELRFHSSNRNHAELAALLLRHAGVGAELKKKEVGKRDVWRVIATADMLAAGREELRKALAEIVETAVKKGWVNADKAERWLKKLKRGRVLMEGWPKYYVGLVRSNALRVKFDSTNPDSIQRETQRLKEMGLEEGRHFSVKMPEGGGRGYVSILREGLERAAWLSVYGSGEQQRLADEFVKYILQRAEEKGKDVYKKALEIVNEGKLWRSLKLEGFEKEVEVDGKKYVVKVIGWGAEFDEGRGGKKLLRLKITAEVGRVEGEHIVDRVVREYTITFGRYGNNAAVGHATASAKAPGGKEADAKRFTAVVKALTGEEPGVYHVENGKRIRIVCYEEHLRGFGRFAELAGTIMRWLVDTSRRRLDIDLDATA
jgi:hypothetical protein